MNNFEVSSQDEKGFEQVYLSGRNSAIIFIELLIVNMSNLVSAQCNLINF